MGIPEGREASLAKGLSNEEFYESLISVIAEIRSAFEQKIHTERKNSLDEHVTSLLIANGACIGLDRLEDDINSRRKAAVEKPV